MSYCEDCGTKLSSGVCSNCQEELYIFTEQNEFLPDNISDDFIKCVNEQKETARDNIKKHYKEINNI